MSDKKDPKEPRVSRSYPMNHASAPDKDPRSRFSAMGELYAPPDILRRLHSSVRRNFFGKKVPDDEKPGMSIVYASPEPFDGRPSDWADDDDLATVEVYASPDTLRSQADPRFFFPVDDEPADEVPDNEKPSMSIVYAPPEPFDGGPGDWADDDDLATGELYAPPDILAREDERRRRRD